MAKPKKNELPPINIDAEPIGKTIAKIRKRRGLTQTQLADKIGITQAVVSDYEVGRAHLSDEMIIRFSLALKISADYILGLKNNGVYEPISRSLANRMSEIEKLPIHEKRVIIKNIDMFLKGAKSEALD